MQDELTTAIDESTTPDQTEMPDAESAEATTPIEEATGAPETTSDEAADVAPPAEVPAEDPVSEVLQVVEEVPEKRVPHRKSRVGLVVSDKMDKSITVLVRRRVQHPLYKKYFFKSKKYMAHDEQNDCNIGDRVRIVETRPLSARKRWNLVEVLERAK